MICELRSQTRGNMIRNPESERYCRAANSKWHVAWAGRTARVMVFHSRAASRYRAAMTIAREGAHEVDGEDVDRGRRARCWEHHRPWGGRRGAAAAYRALQRRQRIDRIRARSARHADQVPPRRV